LLLRLRAQQRASDDDALAADGGTVDGGCCSSLCARETGAYDVAEGIRDDACLGQRVAATTLIAARKVRSDGTGIQYSFSGVGGQATRWGTCVAMMTMRASVAAHAMSRAM
jgi:hypothetical protein